MYSILLMNRQSSVGRTSKTKERLSDRISVSCALQAIALSQFPVYFFFSGLYYTDCVSTAVVLIAYALSQRGAAYVSAWCLCLAVFIRQTNAVWCLFIWALNVLDIIDPDGSVAGGSQSFFLAVFLLMKRAWLNKGRIFLRTSLQLVPVAGLIYFVIINGSIVAGDKEAHKPQLHAMQLLYCLSFCTLAAAPVIVTPSRCVSWIKIAHCHLPCELQITYLDTDKNS